MAVHYRTKGLIFKENNWAEADKVFSIFTCDFGRLEVFAKAIRKITSKLRGGIEIFSLSEIEFIQGKNRKTLTDAVFINNFNNIAHDLEKLRIASKVIQALDNFVKGQEKDEKIWNLIIDIFEKINSPLLSQEKYQLTYYYFIWNFFSILGYKPEVSKCAICQKKLNPYNLYFCNQEGGIICKNCFSKKRDVKKINSSIVKVLRLFFKKDWQTIQKLKIEFSLINLLKEVSEDYYLYLLSSHSFKDSINDVI
ncbi:MAG: DNA repair protein RecO [Patescibacteria group bacterium]